MTDDNPAPPSFDEMIAALRAVIHRQNGHIAYQRGPMTKEEATEHAGLRAALSQLEASRWRPISKAPTDGTRVLLSFDSGWDIDGTHQEIGFWSDSDKPGWYSTEAQSVACTPFTEMPTNFMLLPAPPASDGGEGE